MYRVLLIDDHAYLLETLTVIIPWSELGVDSILTAECTDEALELMASETVEIMITDIKMPGTNGLELARAVRRTWIRTKCIILSG